MSITPEQVLSAYRSSGLRARRGDLYSAEDGCACGLGAVLYYAHGPEMSKKYDLSDTRVICDLLGIDRQYAVEFMAGFDSTPLLYPKTEGYADGQRAWRACVLENIIVPYGRRF